MALVPNFHVYHIWFVGFGFLLSVCSDWLKFDSYQDNLRMGGSDESGEYVQAPIARRFAPNVCSALAPSGACSQAKTSPKWPPSGPEKGSI